MTSLQILSLCAALLMLPFVACNKKSGQASEAAPNTSAPSISGRNVDSASQRSSIPDWPSPPAVPGDWQAVDKQTSRRALDLLVQNISSEWAQTAQQITQFRSLKLPFYPGA